jgi:ribonuclease-3
MTIETTLDYFFFDKRFLNRALTRKAYVLEHQHCQVCQDQDALVLLGGAVLDAVLTEVLIRAGYETQQELVIRKLELKQVENLASISQKLGLEYGLKMGTTEKLRQAYCQPEILAETLEAIIGSIYLDGGFSAARQVVQRLFQDQVVEELMITIK